MSRPSLDIGMIAVRRDEIQAELAKMDRRAEELRGELSELDIAARVFQRLVASAMAPDEDDIPLAAAAGSRKPEGIPTTPEMIVMVLKEAAKPLEPREIKETIAARWWPDVQSEDVGPTAWRMWRRGELAKDSSLYALLPGQAGGLFGQANEGPLEGEADKGALGD